VALQSIDLASRQSPSSVLGLGLDVYTCNDGGTQGDIQPLMEPLEPVRFGERIMPGASDCERIMPWASDCGQMDHS